MVSSMVDFLGDITDISRTDKLVMVHHLVALMGIADLIQKWWIHVDTQKWLHFFAGEGMRTSHLSIQNLYI